MSIQVQTDTSPRYLTPIEVARDLRVSVSTVYAMLKEGNLPRIRVRGQWRIPADRYDRWRRGEEDLSAQQPQIIPLRRRRVGARG